MRRSKKKASLSLSVNAIVVLILAITMLGLGLSFMRGMFQKASGNLDVVFDSNELESPPTEDNPMTLTPPVVNVKQGTKGAKTTIAFMNTLTADSACWLTPPGELVPGTSLTNEWISETQSAVPPKLLANSQCSKITKDQIVKYTVPVITDTSTTAETFLGRFILECFPGSDTCDSVTPVTFSKDLTVIVTA